MKLKEELDEVCMADGISRIEELADMLEVMISLASLENKTLDDIIITADKKRAIRGSFKDKIYLDDVKTK